jgi:GAF domain-containing protein
MLFGVSRKHTVAPAIRAKQGGCYTRALSTRGWNHVRSRRPDRFQTGTVFRACAAGPNLSALAYHALPDVNWLGFYFFDGKELVVGPFQGKPACVRIALGRGVCGTAAVSRQTQRVDDVEAFPGHIPCDAASRSEVVVPLFRGEQLIGVFDIDSPALARFDADDVRGLEALAQVFVESLA